MGEYLSALQAEWRASDRLIRCAVICASPVAAISIFYGLLNFPVIGHDAHDHLPWLEQFTMLRGQGISYPRWLPWTNADFGSPAFYFYPPLVYWLASAVTSIVHLTTAQLFNVMQLVASLVSVLTCYLFLRQSSTPLRALLGSLLFSFVAYRYADTVTRNALTEHWAMMFFPLLFVDCRKPIERVALLALVWSVLILTNIPVALVAGICVAVMIVQLSDWKLLRLHLIAGCIGLLVAAASLFPAFSFLSLIHLSHIRDALFGPTGSVLQDLFAWPITWLQILGLGTWIAGTIIWIRIYRSANRARWSWVAALAILVQLPILGPAIFSLPMLKVIQFGFRFNIALLLFCAIVVSQSNDRLVMWCALSLCLVTLVAQSAQFSHLFHPVKIPNAEYRFDAPEYQPAAVSADIFAAQGIAIRLADDPQVLPLGLIWPGDSIASIQRGANRQTFRVQLAHPTPVRFHQFYWPLWKLYRGTTEIETEPDENGIATALLPVGSYDLEYRLWKSSPENTGVIVSSIGAGILLILLSLAFKSSYRRDRSISPARSPRSG